MIETLEKHLMRSYVFSKDIADDRATLLKMNVFTAHFQEF